MNGKDWFYILMLVCSASILLVMLVLVAAFTGVAVASWRAGRRWCGCGCIQWCSPRRGCDWGDMGCGGGMLGRAGGGVCAACAREVRGWRRCSSCTQPHRPTTSPQLARPIGTLPRTARREHVRRPPPRAGARGVWHGLRRPMCCFCPRCALACLGVRTAHLPPCQQRRRRQGPARPVPPSSPRALMPSKSAPLTQRPCPSTVPVITSQLSTLTANTLPSPTPARRAAHTPVLTRPCHRRGQCSGGCCPTHTS